MEDGREVRDEDFAAYRYIWQSWTKYLAEPDGGKGMRWYEADGATVVNFLQRGVESRKAGARVSDITKRRYWRVLDRMYTYAMEQGLAQVNPATQVMRHEIPKQENHKGHILTARTWDAAIRALHVAPGSSDPIEIRNRALLLVLFEMGLMPIELRSLTLDNYRNNREEQGAWLQIAGATDHAKRQIEVPEHVRVALDAWVQVRATSAKYSSSNALFSAQSGKAMTDETLLLIVRAHLLAACTIAGEPAPQRLGPQIIRNTRIVKWLMDGVPRSVVVLRAGLKNEQGLYHLQMHVVDGPRVRLSADLPRGQLDLFMQAA
jgi:site-specific recombinase XerD